MVKYRLLLCVITLMSSCTTPSAASQVTPRAPAPPRGLPKSPEPLQTTPVQSIQPTPTELERSRKLPVLPQNTASDEPSALVQCQPKGSYRPIPLHRPEIAEARQILQQTNFSHWDSREWTALLYLWTCESGWDPSAVNPRSGACGIPQRYPCKGLNRLSVHEQVLWGLDYIARRYRTPHGAWHHFHRRGWY